MLGRFQIRDAGVAAFIVKIRRCDGSDDLTDRCFRIDGVVRIDMAQSRACFRNTPDLDVLGPFAVSAQIGARFARGYIGKRASQRRSVGRRSYARRYVFQEASTGWRRCFVLFCSHRRRSSVIRKGGNYPPSASTSRLHGLVSFERVGRYRNRTTTPAGVRM